MGIGATTAVFGVVYAIFMDPPNTRVNAGYVQALGLTPGSR